MVDDAELCVLCCLLGVEGCSCLAPGAVPGCQTNQQCSLRIGFLFLVGSEECALAFSISCRNMYKARWWVDEQALLCSRVAAIVLVG
jgi:hypothetical protein